MCLSCCWENQGNMIRFVGWKPWAPWGQWLCFINFLNPMTSTITSPYSRHAINIVKWDWTTHDTKRGSECAHSVFLRLWTWICLGGSAWISPFRCLSAKEGHGLEVFAYKLICRSARLSLSTEGKESDASRPAFWNPTIKFINSNGTRGRWAAGKSTSVKWATALPSPFSLSPPSFLLSSSQRESCRPSGLFLPLWTVKLLRSWIIATNHEDKTFFFFLKKGLI